MVSIIFRTEPSCYLNCFNSYLINRSKPLWLKKQSLTFYIQIRENAQIQAPGKWLLANFKTKSISSATPIFVNPESETLLSRTQIKPNVI